MEQWKEYKIGEIGQVITGKTPRTAIKNNYGGTIPFLTPSDDMSSKYVTHTNKTLTLQGLNEVKNCLLPQNSICVSCIGSDLGKVVKLRENTVTNQQINSIIPFDGFNADFIYYLMCIVGKELNFISKTSTAVPIVNKSTFSNYEVNIPGLSIQTRIADILSSLDNKIEVNRKINRNLEEQAKALFKSWFIDFEPFKDGKFVDSELGMIPEGWEVTTLGNKCKCVLGGTPNRAVPVYWNGNINWINSGAVNAFRIIQPSEMISKDGMNNSATKLLPPKTTVLAITGATLGQISLLEISSCANQSVVGILENEKMPYTFIYLLINSNIKRIMTSQTGGAQQHVNKKNIEDLSFIMPTPIVMENFNNMVKPLLDSTGDYCFENNKLSSIRDTLLPKLISGELAI